MARQSVHCSRISSMVMLSSHIMYLISMIGAGGSGPREATGGGSLTMLVTPEPEPSPLSSVGVMELNSVVAFFVMTLFCGFRFHTFFLVAIFLGVVFHVNYCSVSILSNSGLHHLLP